MILRRTLRSRRRTRQARPRPLRVEVFERRRLLAGDWLTDEWASSARDSHALSLSGNAEGEFVAGPWTNPVNRFDVDNDGLVSTAEALRVFGARANPTIVGQECVDASLANEVSFCVLPTPKPAGLSFVDVSGDGLITDDDGQQIGAFLSGAAAEIYVSPQPNRFQLSTTEAGGTAFFSISLIPAPTADVTISVSSSNTAEGTVSTDSLTFTPSQTIHQVTVTGVADGAADGDQAYAIQFGTAISTDVVYDGMETEDLPVTNIDSSPTSSLDFGDLPNSYGTTLASDGPRHTTGLLLLGSAVDDESDGAPSVMADGDGSDEDGVTQIADLVASSISASTGSFAVVSSLAGKLDAWIDFDGNGSFEHPTEHINAGTSLDMVAGSNVVPVHVPSGLSAGQVATRFRLSSSGGLSPTGTASDGEVEDYFFALLDGSASNDVVITPRNGNTTLTVDGNDVVATTNAIEFFRAQEVR